MSPIPDPIDQNMLVTLTVAQLRQVIRLEFQQLLSQAQAQEIKTPKTVKEVAQILQVTPPTVYRLIRKGHLIQIAGGRIPIESLKAYMLTPLTPHSLCKI